MTKIDEGHKVKWLSSKEEAGKGILSKKGGGILYDTKVQIFRRFIASAEGTWMDAAGGGRGVGDIVTGISKYRRREMHTADRVIFADGSLFQSCNRAIHGNSGGNSGGRKTMKIRAEGGERRKGAGAKVAEELTYRETRNANNNVSNRVWRERIRGMPEMRSNHGTGIYELL